MSSTITDPPSLGLSPEQILDRFTGLQQRLTEQWKLIESMNQLDQAMVVVPSVSVELAAPATVLQAYEERLLFLLFLLRKPRAQIIYCTSQPINPKVIDYYVGLLPGVIPSHARDRLTTVAVHDASSRPLTLKILERPRLIETIRELIPDAKTTHLVPFMTTELERDLALRLGIPMYGADPRFVAYGGKSGGRKVFAEEAVAHPLGMDDLRSEDQLVEALLRMRQHKPEIELVMVKHNDGVSGEGNAQLSLRDLPAPGSADEVEGIRSRLQTMRLELEDGVVTDFLNTLYEQGGVVEERVVGDVVRSPSVQLRVTPLGRVEVLSTHDQVLGGASGQSYLGCRFPADPGYSVMITREALKVGARLAREGVLGRFAVDFVVVRDAEGGWHPYAIEINLRKGGTTGPYLTLEFLTNGHYNADTGEFTTPGGVGKFYVANDHVEADVFRAITPDDLFDFVVRHGLHFDHTTQTGVVLHMLSAITEQGRFGLTAVGNSHEEAQELFDRTVATLNFEAERAGDDPGLPD